MGQGDQRDRGRTHGRGWPWPSAGPLALLGRAVEQRWQAARAKLGRRTGTIREWEKRGRPTGPKTGKGERREENSFFLFYFF